MVSKFGGIGFEHPPLLTIESQMDNQMETGL